MIDAQFPRSGRRILLVEDNPGDVRLVREALTDSPSHPQLSVACDAVEAAASLSNQPDLILLDLNLPRKSGRELLAEIKHDPLLRRIPVVILTTSAAIQDVLDSYAMHANSYVTKPLDVDDFLWAVRTIAEFWFQTAMLPA
jgi:two-component system, chemotaxis family, response regulator Rcp1